MELEERLRRIHAITLGLLIGLDGFFWLISLFWIFSDVSNAAYPILKLVVCVAIRLRMNHRWEDVVK